MWTPKLHPVEPTELAGVLSGSDIDPAHAGPPTDAGEVIAPNRQSLTASIHRLLRQQDEPPGEAVLLLRDEGFISIIFARSPRIAIGLESKMWAAPGWRVSGAMS